MSGIPSAADRVEVAIDWYVNRDNLVAGGVAELYGRVLADEVRRLRAVKADQQAWQQRPIIVRATDAAEGRPPLVVRCPAGNMGEVAANLGRTVKYLKGVSGVLIIPDELTEQ